VSTEFKRSLGLFDATSIVAGSMIGSGIFIVTTIMMRDIGSVGWLLVLWLLTGLITIFAALSYGELAGMMPNAGGQYVYIQRAFGKLTSFLYGWTVFGVIQTGVIAAVAVAFAKYTAVFFPSLNNSFLLIDGVINVTFGQLLAVGSIIFLTFLNTGGIQNGKWLQLIFTSAKLLALFALIFFGIYVGLNKDIWAANFTNIWEAKKTIVHENQSIEVIPLAGFALIGALGATIINSLFSSDAWNNVTFIAGEIKNPQKNIPRSLLLGTIIVTVIYILANIAYLMLLPVDGSPTSTSALGQGIMFPEQDRIGANAASMIVGEIGVWLMAGLIMISTFGCNNGLILSGSRLYYAMAKDGLFLKQAGELNKNNVPGKALWIQCFWACLLCFSGKYSDLVVYSTFASLLFYIITIGGIFVLRKKEPETERPYKVIGYPFTPIFYILTTLAICTCLLIYDTRNAGIGLFIVILGVPVYYLMSARKQNKF
jgi:APA family basic amino acid/polyamine antiporter